MWPRLGAFAVASMLISGCAESPKVVPATLEEEKAAEERIKEEAARELKARQAEHDWQRTDPDER